jgi:hypothetical protein
MTSQRRSPPLRETAGKVGFPRTRASLSRLSISSDRDGLGCDHAALRSSPESGSTISAPGDRGGCRTAQPGRLGPPR